MKEKIKNILYGTGKAIILFLAIEFIIQLFAVVNLFVIMTLELSMTPLQYFFNVLYAIGFVLLIINVIPDNFFKRKKKGGKK